MVQPRIDMAVNEVGAEIGKRLVAVGRVIQESSLPRATQELVILRASQINGCGRWVDIATKEAAAAGETALRLHLVATWPHAQVFDEAEQAALALTEEGTRLCDAHDGVADETWERVRDHYDDDQLAALVSLVAMINATNRLSVILDYRGGSYEPGTFATISS